MLRQSFTVGVAGLLACAATAHAAPEVSLHGVTQITAEQGGNDGAQGGDGLVFGADRVRLQTKVTHTEDKRVYSMLQVDFNQTGADLVDNKIKDAKVGYKLFTKEPMGFDLTLEAGLRKTPIGMDFNTPGNKLDITKRGLDKALVFERSAGAFAYGALDAGPGEVGLALAITDQPLRSSGAIRSQTGATPDDLAYSGRVSYDMGDMFYGEVSGGIASVSNSAIEPYNVIGIGVRSKPVEGLPLTLKGEYLMASNVGYVEDNDESVWYIHAGYGVTPNIEGVVRHYQADHETPGGTETDLGNTYVGVNLFANPEKRHYARVQLNYIIVSGDDEGAYNGIADRSSRFRDNSFLAQFQTAF